MAETNQMEETKSLPPLSRKQSVSSGGKSSKPKLQTIYDFISNRTESWTLYTASQNLPSALNDPNNRETDLFTKTWGESFVPYATPPPSSLPNIELGDFMCYLKETASGRKSHRAIVRQMEKEKSNVSTPTSPAAPRKQIQLDGRVYDLNNIPKIFMQKDFSLLDSRTFLQVIPLPHLLPHNLMSPNNLLMTPEEGTNMATLQSTKLLHEKLTHHLDVIEVHLAHQISLRSDLFFTTLTSQRELESLIMQVRQDALELRHHVRLLDKKLTHPLLRVYFLKRQSIRRSRVCRQLQQIATVHQTQHTIQLLLRTSDFIGALELIYRTQNILATDLQGVISLRHLSSQLMELEKAIEAMMENDLVHVAMEDLKSRLQSSKNNEDSLKSTASSNGLETEMQLESVVKGLLRRKKLHFVSTLRENILSSSKQYVKQIVEDCLQVSDEIKYNEEEPPLKLADQMRSLEFNEWFNLLDKLFSSLLTYMRCVQKMLSVVTLVCKEEAGMLTPVTTPMTTPKKLEFFDNVFEPKLSKLSDEEEEVGGDKVMEVFEDHESEDRLDQLLMDEELSDVHITALALSTESMQQQEVNNKQQEVNGKQQEVNGKQQQEVNHHRQKSTRNNESIGGITNNEYQEVITDCQEIVCSLCDLLHSRCTKILNIRAKVGLLDDLHPSDFVRLVRLIGRFVNSSVGVAGRPCPHLRLALLSQAKKFLEVFHENKKDKLRRLLDGERWRQADVPPEVQLLTASLEEGLTPATNGLNNQQTSKPKLNKQTSQHPEQFLTVHGQKFAVVGVLCLLINMITEYCQTADDLPMLITDVLNRLVDLLKFFNSYTCQLVLGAGAVEMVGLKTITTRHLAIVIRCLQAMMLIIQDIKVHFRKKLTPKKCVLLLQFDQVIEFVYCQDIGSHCREINQKIITIMDEATERLLAKWEVKSPTPSQSFKTITKQLLKLHEALDDLLPSNHLQALFQSIENRFKFHLKNHLSKLGITNNGSTEHGIVHSELTNMKGSLQPLEHINVFGSELFDIWTDNINR